MKRIISSSSVFLFLLLISIGTLYAHGGNLVHNGSFETRENTSAAASKPDDIAQADYLADWQDDMNIVTPGDDEFALHSPDWYMNVSGYLQTTEFPSNSIIPAHNSNAYIGMGPYELIQQEFYQAERLIPGKEYTISMFIRTVQGTNTMDGSWSSANTSLHVWIRTEKQKYSQFAQLAMNRCNRTYTNHAEFNGSEVEIMSIPINLSSYPVGEWHKVSATFTAPSDAGDYNWLTIETHDPNYPDEDNCEAASYVLIDDVELIRSCELSCYPTSGIPDPLVGSTTGFACMVVTGLDNVSTAVIQVFQVGGQTALWERTIYGYNHGITNPVYWHGFIEVDFDGDGIPDGLSGPVANGPYECRITATNDCGTSTSTHQFVKIDDPTSVAPVYTYPNGPKVPYPCCLYDLHIYNEILTGTLFYSVGHNLTAGPSVLIPNGSTVTFNAENEILLAPDVDIRAGTDFIAEIVDCPNFKLGDPNADHNSPDIPAIEVPAEDAILLSPNPTDGVFTVSAAEDIRHISIYNTLGGLIHSDSRTATSFSFDLSGKPAGVYYIRIEKMNGEIVMRKLIHR